MDNAVRLRNYIEEDEERILELNEIFVEDLSPMDAARFSDLRAICAYLRVAERNGEVAGFILAFTAACPYDSPNFRWFCDNLHNFLYIDRIVISSDCQGLGIGQKFYNAAREWAISHSIENLAAEINVLPPNAGSLRFHEKMGFVEMAQKPFGEGKMVSLQKLPIS